MKNLALALVLLTVAAISYGLGRRHGSKQEISTADALGNMESAHADLKPTAARKVTRASADPDIKTLNQGAPFAQNLNSAQRGYEAARINLDDALNQIESLPIAERMGFIAGVFSFVARNHAPADALKVYQRVPEKFRGDALRALVGEWVYTRSPLDEDQRHSNRERAFATSGSRVGLAIELTSM